MKILKWFGFWLKNARAASLPQSVMPAAAAVIVCIGEPGFSVLYAILAVIGVALLHLAFNLLDDRFDYISHQTGYRNTLERAGFRAYTDKCPYLTGGEATVKDLTAACAVFGLAGLLCGLVILIGRGLPIFIVVLITVFLGWFYSGKPLRLSYHGLGEPVIGIIFGPLNVCGVSLACVGSISSQTVLLGVIMGFLVMNILYTHSVLDYAADQSVNKQTLASLLPSSGLRLVMSGFLVFIPYVLICAAVLCRWLPLIYLLVLLVLPLSIAQFQSVRTFVHSPEKKVQWRKWYGPCGGDWGAICAANLDWFLQRWMLARNIVTATAFAYIAASIIEKVVM